MTEEQVKQFTKRPPAQYRRPEFYFRGGDALREQEYLQEEFKKALSDFRIAQQRLQQVQEEVDDATDVLAEREGYTHALATYLERDTQAATTENQMKNQLRKLEREIADLEVALKEVKSYHNPAALAALQKEKAHYMIEIQRGNRTIATSLEQKDEAVRQIAACTVNGRYRETRNLEYAVEKTMNKKNRLRKSVANLKKEFDVIKPKTPYQDKDSRLCRNTLLSNIPLQIELFRTQERDAVRKSKHEKHINDLLDQICELNDRMVEIGIPDDVVNIDEFRERVLNEDYSDDEVEEEQEEPQYNNEGEEHESENQPQEHGENAEEPTNEETENKNEEEDKKSETDKNEDPSMSGDFEDDDDKKSKSNTNKSMSNDFDDDDDKKSKSNTNKSMSNDFDDDEEKKETSGGGDDDDDDDKKSKSTTNKSMSNDFDDDEEKKETSGGGDDDDDEKKETSGGGDDDDDEKKETSGGGDDDEDEKKTTSGGGDDDDDDEKKSATENDDDDEKKNSESNDFGDDGDFENDD